MHGFEIGSNPADTDDEAENASDQGERIKFELENLVNI